MAHDINLKCYVTTRLAYVPYKTNPNYRMNASLTLLPFFLGLAAQTSRVTGKQYSTTVIEAIGVEHKETTRNYDILAAVFTDVLRRMHDDFDFI